MSTGDQQLPARDQPDAAHTDEERCLIMRTPPATSARSLRGRFQKSDSRMAYAETPATNGSAVLVSIPSATSTTICRCRRRENGASCSQSPSDHRRRKRSAPDSDSSSDEDDDLRFYEYSTFHGVRDLFHSKSSLMSSLWLFTLIAAVLCSVYGCAAIIMEYVQRPVVVSYIQESVNKLSLPDVVVCPFNRFNHSFLEEHNVSAGLAQYLELSFPSPVPHSFQKHLYLETIKNIDRFEYELEQLLARMGNITYTEFIHRASLHCSAFFDETQFPICDNLTEIMTSAGKCFRIPGADQEGDGFGYGIRVVIRLPHRLFNPGVNQLLNDGIAVKLAERNRGIDHDLTFIPSGVHAIMPLYATRYDFMNDPPRYMCNHDADQTYSRIWCFEICLTKEAEDTCNCSLAASAVPRKPLLCTTKQFFHCFLAVVFSANHSKLVDSCKRQCRPPCSFWQYDKSVSYARFPAPEARFFVANDSEWEQLTHTIILEVFYTSLDYTVIKHMVSMTANSFVAQIGGQVSLWIGGSIISVFQLLIYILRYCCVCTERRIRKGKRIEYQSKDKANNRSKIVKYQQPPNVVYDEADCARNSFVNTASKDSQSANK
uniref:Uncharacterized protein n=1 Tax=Plectus sambesii TaxID=2011161 RepID=A0A914XR84_9BILA